MNILMVAFDLELAKKRGANDLFVSTIKAQPGWARIIPNTYLVKTPLTPAQLRDQMTAEKSSKLIVYDVTNQLWAGYSFTPKVRDWIQANWRQN